MYVYGDARRSAIRIGCYGFRAIHPSKLVMSLLIIDPWCDRRIALATALSLLAGFVILPSAVAQDLPDMRPALIGMAKVFSTDIEQKMVEVASQWAGRAGRTGEAFGGHLLAAWQVAPSFSIRGGTNEVLRGIIARRALGL